MWHKLYNLGHHFMVICEFKRFSIGVFSNWVSLSRVNVIDSTWHSWIIDIFQETSFVFDMDTSKMLSFFIRFGGRRVFPFSCLFFVWNNLLENPARRKPNISWNFQIFLYIRYEQFDLNEKKTWVVLIFACLWSFPRISHFNFRS